MLSWRGIRRHCWSPPSGGRTVSASFAWKQANPVFRAMHDPCGETPTGRELRPVGKWIGGAAAYMVDRHGAAQVVKAFSKPFQTVDRSRSVDRTLFDLRISRIARRLRPVQIVPGMAYQVDSPSDYDEWRKIVRWRVGGNATGK